ncbi:MAG: hypothetical protein ACR2HF_06705 [Methylococcaceae bacterium]
MQEPDILRKKITFLSQVAQKEHKHLLYSQAQVFAESFTQQKADTLLEDEAFAADLEAFTSRFCRFQDTLGDKLFPAWLELVGEKQKTFLDNLFRLEKLEVIASAEGWLQIRSLRNKMVHEYINSTVLLTDAVNQANDYIPELEKSFLAILNDMENR